MQLQIRLLRHKNIKTIRYFIFFLNSDSAKGGASAPLAPPPVAPLLTIVVTLGY